MSLCSPGGELSHSDPATHLQLVKKELDQLHQQVGVHQYELSVSQTQCLLGSMFRILVSFHKSNSTFNQTWTASTGTYSVRVCTVTYTFHRQKTYTIQFLISLRQWVHKNRCVHKLRNNYQLLLYKFRPLNPKVSRVSAVVHHALLAKVGQPIERERESREKSRLQLKDFNRQNIGKLYFKVLVRYIMEKSSPQDSKVRYLYLLDPSVGIPGTMFRQQSASLIL